MTVAGRKETGGFGAGNEKSCPLVETATLAHGRVILLFEVA